MKSVVADAMCNTNRFIEQPQFRLRPGGTQHYDSLKIDVA